MNNTQVDLQNLLFGQLEWILDRDIRGAELDEEIKRGLAANEIAKTIVANGALMAKAVDVLSARDYKPDMDCLPLLPMRKVSEKEKEERSRFLEGEKMRLINARTNREAG